MRLLLSILALLALASPALAQTPGTIRVRLVTSAGAIVVALNARKAPKTTANFLAYVDDGRFEGTVFYRSARKKVAPGFGFIQGGIRTQAQRILPVSVPLERTDVTGLKHLDGTISMARGPNPDSAAGNFSIMVGPTPSLDARPDSPGYAAFGQVISGMDVVRRILALPTGGGSGAMRGQMILQPVTLIRAERLDGTPKPTGGPKPWLLGIPVRD